MAVPGLDPGINTAISLIPEKKDSRVKPANDVVINRTLNANNETYRTGLARNAGR